jgi:hypothetical protein
VPAGRHCVEIPAAVPPQLLDARRARGRDHRADEKTAGRSWEWTSPALAARRSDPPLEALNRRGSGDARRFLGGLRSLRYSPSAGQAPAATWCDRKRPTVPKTQFLATRSRIKWRAPVGSGLSALEWVHRTEDPKQARLRIDCQRISSARTSRIFFVLPDS